VYDLRIGFGYDVHQLVENRRLIIGGVDIQHTTGLLGHSDADVLVHSIMDSILGALALGDIGKHFPDTDMKYKDINSMILLENVYGIMTENGYEIGNIDATIAAQKPRLAPYINEMRKNISETLRTSIDNISIKATTTEKLGFEGRQEGISATCVCLLKTIDNK
jgi:2-C-methyl-D-erythritol 2,4-cyclodiphosphate synthase